MTMADEADAKEPVAGLSAASSCVRLSLLPPSPSGSGDGGGGAGPPPPTPPPFRPVYTHQCFEGERVRGWRPLEGAEGESRQIYQSWIGGADDDGANIGGGGLHKSYRNCQRDRPKEEGRLEVQILLTPSCETCDIEITTEKYVPEKNDGEPAPKKAKKVSFGGVAPDDDAKEEEAQKQMDLKDVVEKIASAVPPIASVKTNGVIHCILPLKKKQNDGNSVTVAGSVSEPGGYLSKPIGRVLKTYQRNGKDDGPDHESHFVITIADGSDPNVSRYHNSVQPLARWFIETADDVDLSDSSRGSWRVMYLFERHPHRRLSLAGYITLLHVSSPFRKPRPGTIVRVCQALVLPPYHGSGHGSEMLNAVHDYADERNEALMAGKDDGGAEGVEMLEVNVEDPAPAFVSLRDRVDYRRFLSKCVEDERVDTGYLTEHEVTSKERYSPVSEERLLSVAECLKVTKRQAQIVHEVYKLEQLEEWKQSLSNDEKDRELIAQVETSYRLMVKRSLRTLRQEELGACEDGKEGQKALLGKWFDETLRGYRRVLRSRIK